ncbi:MAG: porin family protein [Mucilaginibacter sp.]
MKKLVLSLFIITSVIFTAQSQILPNVQFGIKGGLNLASVSSNLGNTFSSSNQTGYLGGVWARFGALGFNFQPEVYITKKSTDVTSNGVETKANFTSIDVPLLLGAKIGALGIGGRFYTGPVISFAINKDQSIVGASNALYAMQYKDQNYAWQFGAGLDIKAISFDLRYEAGLTSQSYQGSSTKLNLFSLTVAYRLIKL